VNVLYIAPEHALEPYYHDFLEAAGERHAVSLYDFASPARAQFDGIDVVLEHGGAFSTREMIDAGVSSGVKLWQVTATGLDHVDVAAFLERGVTLANMPGLISTAIPMAEHALLLMLALSRSLFASQASFAARVVNLPMTSELHGKTLGLIGLGASGRELARRACAMGMRVMAVDVVDVPERTRQEIGVEFFGLAGELDHVLAASDFVSLHLPLTAGTRHTIDRRALALMKPTAYLVNVARGDLVDEGALLAALENGQLAGAGLDALANEPVDPSHPLLRLDNVIATPHNGVVTRELSRRRARVAVEQIARVSENRDALYLVTREPVSGQ
jgi:phosphoglycerate dehydrogenase-like enzyme